jgi:hypothetical protein
MTSRRYAARARTWKPILLHGLGQSADQISPTPTAGAFYQVKKGDNVVNISRAAYGTPQPGIFRINDSPYNSYIRKAATGWEPYKVLGLQLTPYYSPNRGAYGTGQAYPILWIPPPPNYDEPDEDGPAVAEITAAPAQPMQGPPGQRGEVGPQGKQGIPGPAGPQGAPGKGGATDAQINAAISKYMQAHPTSTTAKAGPAGKQGPPGPAPTSAQMQAEIAKYYAAHTKEAAAMIKKYAPPGPPGKTGPAGPAAKGGASDAQINAAISKYMQAHPLAASNAKIGPVGPPGPQGPAGTSATPEAIAAAISKFMEANPITVAAPAPLIAPSSSPTTTPTREAGSDLARFVGFGMLIGVLKVFDDQPIKNASARAKSQKMKKDKKHESLDWSGFCAGCGEEIDAKSVTWHGGQPFCKGCEDSPQEDDD